MNNIILKSDRGEEVELTEDEAKMYRTLKRLEKMDFGRFYLFASGSNISLRICDGELNSTGGCLDEVDRFSIPSDGGDGGDEL